MTTTVCNAKYRRNNTFMPIYTRPDFKQAWISLDATNPRKVKAINTPLNKLPQTGATLPSKKPNSKKPAFCNRIDPIVFLNTTHDLLQIITVLNLRHIFFPILCLLHVFPRNLYFISRTSKIPFIFNIHMSDIYRPKTLLR